MAENFAIEVDLRSARCGTPMVFHDDMLNRLTTAEGALRDRLASELSIIAFKDTSDKMLSLQELLALVDGRVPLILEVKSEPSGDGKFEKTITKQLQDYRGPVAVMSFAPRSLEAFAQIAPELPRGLISEGFRNRSYWSKLTGWQRFAMRNLLSSSIARPHFIAYDIRALPAPAPLIARHIFNLPLLTWTVRTEAEQARAKRYADAAIFERDC